MPERAMIGTIGLNTIPDMPEVKSAAKPAAEAQRVAAQEFEAAFVQEMLKHAGLAEAFGSGAGQAADAFSSYLLEHVARELVDAGGFGLTERFYERLKIDTPDGPTGVKL
jgi:Rod binding domain-containing protein